MPTKQRRYVLILGDDRYTRVEQMSARMGISMADFVRLSLDRMLLAVQQPPTSPPVQPPPPQGG